MHVCADTHMEAREQGWPSFSITPRFTTLVRLTLFYVYNCFTCMRVVQNVQTPWKPWKNTGSSGTRVRDACRTIMKVLGIKPGSLGDFNHQAISPTLSTFCFEAGTLPEPRAYQLATLASQKVLRTCLPLCPSVPPSLPPCAIISSLYKSIEDPNSGPHVSFQGRHLLTESSLHPNFLALKNYFC